MNEQHIGRKRTVSVLQEDGSVTKTTLQTVGLAKPSTATTPKPDAAAPAQQPAATPQQDAADAEQ